MAQGAGSASHGFGAERDENGTDDEWGDEDVQETIVRTVLLVGDADRVPYPAGRAGQQGTFPLHRLVSRRSRPG